MLMFPQFNPVALQIGPVAIHWYGISYVVALMLGLWYVKHLTRKHPTPGVTADTFESLFTYIVLGVILGGRLGYVFFYAPSQFLANPLEIFMVWNGGMSFHGGLLGVITAVVLFAWRKKVPLSALADPIAAATPIGLFLVRLANFINGELVGRPTSPNLPWSMVFPHVDTLPRHPSQLYEALLEGLLLFAILFFATRKSMPRWQATGIFVTGYALARIFVENFRMPEITHNLGFITLTQGQTLSLPMLAIGLALLAFSGRAPSR